MIAHEHDAGTARTAKPGAVTAAIAAKVLQSFFRDPLVFLPTLLQGVLFFLLFRYVFAGAISSGSLEYVDYMTPGIVVAAVLFGATQAALAVAHENAQGFTDRVLSMPVPRLGITAGRVLAHSVIGFSGALTTLAVAFLAGFRTHAPVLHLPGAALLLLLFAVACASLFVALGAVVSSPEAAQSLAFLAIPLTLVSSALVPTDTMPQWLAAVAQHQPMTLVINALRQLTHPEALGLDQVSLTISLLWVLVLGAGSLAVATARLSRPRSGRGL